MQRDPAARYQSAAEMANGLRKVAVENGYMASRADIAAWVKGSFKKEFAARREAVRKRATEVAVTISDVQDLPSLPSLAGLSSPSLSGVRGSSTGDSGSLSSPAEPTKAFSSPQVEAPKQAGSRSKVAIAVAAIAGMAVAAVAIVVLNRAQRPSATPAVVAEAPAKVETVTTPQPNAKVEPTPSVVPPTPTVVPEASQAKPVAAPTTAPRAPRPAAPTKATATASASVAPAVAAPPPPPQPVVKKPVDLDSPDLPQ
jgi:hypothetical protein